MGLLTSLTVYLTEKPQGLWPRSGGRTLAGLIPVALAGIYHQAATGRTYEVLCGIRRRCT
jgi:hypothetical protein